MNEIATIQSNPITRSEIMEAVVPASKSEILKMIMIMGDGFPARQLDEGGVRNRNEAYCMALEEMPLEAIQRACRRFIRAEVERSNHTFLPTCAELAAETRLEFWKLVYEKRRTKQ